MNELIYKVKNEIDLTDEEYEELIKVRVREFWNLL